MAANTSPIFCKNGYVAPVAIATANANRDGTGTIGVVVTATAEGTRIMWVRIKATAVTTAGTIRFYINTGAAYFLIDEITVSAITPSATLPSFTYLWSPPAEGLVIPTGYKFEASTEKAENFNVVAYCGDY